MLIEGDDGKDRIDGTGEDDTIRGFGGNDQIEGRAGDDLIEGGVGNDRLFGEDGSDTLFGGGGGDTLSGGSYFGYGSGFDHLYGEAGNDSLMASGEGNFLDGGTGDDWLHFDSDHGRIDSTILGGAGADKLLAYNSGKAELRVDMGADNDRIEMMSPGRATISGGDGDDLFLIYSPKKLVALGGDGADVFEVVLPGTPREGLLVIKAGKGDDSILVNGYQTFELTLGGGRDTVTFSEPTGDIPNPPVEIFDFRAGARGDDLDVSAMLKYWGDPYNWDGADDAFMVGRLRLVQDGADTVVEADFDGEESAWGWTALAVLRGTAGDTFTAANFHGYDPELQA